MSEVPARKSDLGVRTLSAIVMLAVAGGALWLGGWYWSVFVGLVSAAVYFEWRALARRFVSAKFASALWLLAGLIYAAVGGATLVFLRESPKGIFGVGLIVGGVIAVDVGAYFAGRSIGGPKIAPSISPSKTWAGLFGGVLGATIVIGGLTAAWWNGGLCEAYLGIGTQNGAGPVFGFDGPCSFGVGPLHWFVPQSLLLGTLFAVVAQAGDFFESWMKRRAGVKDSSNLIPGHGGLFDRADGLLAVCFVIGLIYLVGSAL